jgi:phenylalanine-4-hydroxylase
VRITPKLQGKHAWLEAELAAWTKLLESANDKQRAAIVQTLRHWQGDTDLAGIRDTEALAALPESERAAWQALWERVDSLMSTSARATFDHVFPGDPFAR